MAKHAPANRCGLDKTFVCKFDGDLNGNEGRELDCASKHIPEDVEVPCATDLAAEAFVCLFD